MQNRSKEKRYSFDVALDARASNREVYERTIGGLVGKVVRSPALRCVCVCAPGGGGRLSHARVCAACHGRRPGGGAALPEPAMGVVFALGGSAAPLLPPLRSAHAPPPTSNAPPAARCTA